MEIKINTYKYNLDLLPTKCPYCHHKIFPEYLIGHLVTNYETELLFSCPDIECNHSFIAFYGCDGDNLFYKDRTSVGEMETQSFSEEITNISPDFVEIYNQGFVAEKYELLQICGVGYRKSLEFLIKDFLIHKTPEKGEDIKKLFLSDCIKQIDNIKLKNSALRATWLGNDETHYTRKWENQSLVELKKLIQLAIHWIETEITNEQFDNLMPIKD